MGVEKEKLQFTINVEIECTEPESFDSQKQFKEQDANAMKKYISDKIKNSYEY